MLSGVISFAAEFFMDQLSSVQVIFETVIDTSYAKDALDCAKVVSLEQAIALSDGY